MRMKPKAPARRALAALGAAVPCLSLALLPEQLATAAGASPSTVASQPAAPSSDAAFVPEEGAALGERPMFRNLVPSPLVEAQSAADYAYLIERARSEDRLLPADDARVERVRAIAMRIAPFADKWSDRVKAWRWEVNVVRSREIGIVCLPGGKLLVYSGLLDRIRLTDDELGVLFGHMIAHALREQVREQLSVQQSTPFGTGPMPRLFGVAELDGTSPAAASGIGGPILVARFDATDETEADVIGSDIAARAGFDPRGAVPLWDKLAQATRGEKGNGFIHAHPYSEARRLDILKRLPDMLALYAKARGVEVDTLADYPGVRPPTAKRVHHR